MTEIKLINKGTDLEKEKVRFLNWEACIPAYGEGSLKNALSMLDVYQVDGFYHTIGGRYGNNDYWCCLRGQKLTTENCMEFNGHPCNWSYRIVYSNAYRHKWGESSIEDSYRCEIFRNGELFYNFIVNKEHYGISKLQQLMFEIHEHPVAFHMQKYEKEIIGREILWKEIPSVITQYCKPGRVLIEPATETQMEEFFKDMMTDYFKIPYKDKFGQDGYVTEDLFAPSINWFR